MKDHPLAGRTAIISGGSRGIGFEIARSLVAVGARVAILGKTEEPQEGLPGTVHTAAEELRRLGGEVLPLICDIRDEEAVARAVQETVDTWGGIDLCVNNASALNLADVGTMSARRFDLLMDVNVRGTYALTHACLPHLRESSHAHVLTMSPPLNLDPAWFKPAPYTVSKYGMTIVTLGVAESERENAVAANTLWPLTAIATSAVKNLLGGDAMTPYCRSPQIVADAAMQILASAPSELTGKTTIVEDVLREAGLDDLSRYDMVPDQSAFAIDFFIDAERLGSQAGPSPLGTFI